MADPDPTPTPKPGIKTTEYWFSKAAVILSGLFATDIIPTSGLAAKVAIIAAITLTALGYTVSRSVVKAAGVLLVIGIAAGSISLQACAWLKDEGSQAGHAMIDCTTASAKDAISQFGPTVDALLAQSTTDGKVNWDPVRDLTKGFKAELGGCVLASVVSSALHPRPAAPGAPKASQLELDPFSLKAGFEKLRAEQLGGATFKTDAGTL